MKRITSAAALVAAALAAAAILPGCSSAPGAEGAFGAGRWLIDGEEAERAMVGDEIEMEIPADPALVPEGSPAVVVVRWDNLGKSGVLAKIDAEAAGGRIRASWKIDDADEFYMGDGYSVPRYTFTAEAAGETSADSAKLDVYGFVKNRAVNEDGEPLAGAPYRLYRTDGKVLTGFRDEDGWFRIDWLPLGKYSLKLEGEQ